MIESTMGIHDESISSLFSWQQQYLREYIRHKIFKKKG